MQSQQAAKNQQKVHIYLRNNQKVAYFIPLTREIKGQYLYAVASKLFQYQRDQIALFRSGIQLPPTDTLKLNNKEIVHIVSISNCLAQQITIKILHNKISRSFRVTSSIKIQFFIENSLSQEYGKEGMKIILIYLGKALDENKKFRQQFIENESQLSLFYIQQIFSTLPKNMQNPETAKIKTQQLKESNQVDSSKSNMLILERNQLPAEVQIQEQLDQKQEQNIKKIENYQQLFDNEQLYSLALSISPRLKQFYWAFGQLFLKHIKINRIEPIYSDTLFLLFKFLQYKLPPMADPVCSKVINQYFICKDCQHSQNEKMVVCICQQCLNQGNHQGHNLRLVTNDGDERFFGTCDCGKKQVLNSTSFCTKHKGQYQTFVLPQQLKKDQQLFIKQMQFIFFLFFKLKEISKGYLDQNKKKQIIAIHFVTKLGLFQSEGYINKNILTSFLSSTFPENFPFCTTKQKKMSMVRMIFQCQSYNLFLTLFCKKLLLQLQFMRNTQQIIIKEYFDFIRSLKTSYVEQSPLQNIKLYLANGKVIVNLLKSGKIKPLTIKQNIQNLGQRYQTFFQLYNLYGALLTTKQQQQIMQFTLLKLNIKQLFPRITSKELKVNKSAILSLDIHCIFFIFEVMNKLQNYQRKQVLLRKIIRQSYSQLKKKQQSVSLSIQRTFTFALFIYFNYSLSNINQFSGYQLLSLFEQESLKTLVQNIQMLIKKSMFIAKADNFSIYYSVIVQGKLQNQQVKIQNQKYKRVILSLDSTYIKILITILNTIKVNTASEINHILEEFIKKRQKVLTSLYEIFDNNEVSKIEQTIDVILCQICQISNILVQALESPIGEIILRESLDKAQQSEIVEIYKLLIYKNKEVNAKQFKVYAEKCLIHNKVLKKFIKEDFNHIKNQLNNNRQLFKNTLNCSYSSYFITFKSTEECQILYYLKLSKNNRSQISKSIFNDKIIDIIIQTIQWYFNAFQTSMRHNQNMQSKRTISVIIQTLILLHLQTLSKKIKNTIDNILRKPWLMSKITENIKVNIGIYVRNNQKLQETLKTIKQQSKTQQLKQMQAQKKGKKNQKLLQIKNKQKQTLQKFKHMGQISSQIQKNQQKVQCIVCKGASSSQKLNYLCYFRYNNLVSQQMFKQNFPIILITTCGHFIHQECLFNNIRNSLLNLFEYNCFLCKSRSNMLMPAMNSYNNQEGKQFLIYLEMIQHLYLQETSGSLRMHRLTTNMDLPNRMFISCIYIIYGYYLNFPHFFGKSIFPIIKIIVKFFKGLKIQTSLAKKYFQKIQTNKEQIIKISNKLIDIMALNQDLLETLQGFLQRQMKPSQNLLLSLPEDLTDLNKLIGKCSKCNKFTSKQVICLLCRLRMCQKCNESNYEHIKKHYGHAVFIHLENGQYTYAFANYKIKIGCLYLDYIGQQIPNVYDFAAKGQYKLNKQLKSTVDSDILNDEIPFKVMEQTETRCVIQ